MRLRFLGLIDITIGESDTHHSIKVWMDDEGKARAPWKELNAIRSWHVEQSSKEPLRCRTPVITRKEGFTRGDVEIHRIEPQYHRRGERYGRE